MRKNLRLHAHDFSCESKLPPVREKEKKEKACPSLVTASMNEKQLGGMLHYRPISSTGGGELVVSLFTSQQVFPNHASEGGWRTGGFVSGTGLQTRNWAECPPPQLTRPCTSSFV